MYCTKIYTATLAGQSVGRSVFNDIFNAVSGNVVTKQEFTQINEAITSKYETVENMSTWC